MIRMIKYIKHTLNENTSPTFLVVMKIIIGLKNQRNPSKKGAKIPSDYPNYQWCCIFTLIIPYFLVENNVYIVFVVGYLIPLFPCSFLLSFFFYGKIK